MKCNLLAYIEEQEMTCLRIAKAANEGTQAQQEWLKTAQVLIDRAKDHQKACKTCSRALRQAG